MIYTHTQPINKYKSYTEGLKLIKGQMSEKEAKISLAKFMRENLGFAYQFMSGIELHPVQEIILKHMFLRDKGMIVAGRGSGKCASYSIYSNVYTQHLGIISIPELIPNLEFKDEEYILNIPPVKLWNGESYQETSKVLVQKDKDCMKVKTRCGYFVEGSTNHKIKVFDKKVGDVVWKRYHKLDKKNDFICISRNNIPEDIMPQQDELDNAHYHGLLYTCLEKVPSYIMKNKYVSEKFLKSAFKNGKIKTKNELLAHQIHLILLTFGKITKLYKENENYCINYNYEDLENKEDYTTYHNFYYDPIDSIEYSTQNCIDFMDIPDGACYWGNGFINHNSFMISVFCTIYPLLYPNTKICIISANFRSARRILEESHKIINGKNAMLLRQCFTSEMKKAQDAWRWRIEENGSQISALPLGNNEGLRGERASVVLVDEGLLIDEHIQKFIIEPFLASKLNYSEQRNIIKQEEFLIKTGKMLIEDRTIFSPNKYFVFSSASFQFEYLYTLYNKYIDYTQMPISELSHDVDNIDDEEAKFFRKPEYFVSRFSYKVFQKQSHMDLAMIEGVKAEGGEDSDYFKREYMAQFIDLNSAYFNAKKMKECTVKDGEFPCVELKSSKNGKYILSIDPSYSSDESADFFAMGVYKIDETNNTICLVHSYARAGCELKQHHEYMAYLLTYFNIVFLICDVQGGEIISGFNESRTASDLNLNLKFIDVKLNKAFEEDYKEEIRKAKDLYDISTQRIVYGQTFTGDSIRAMNEHLQNKINLKKVWFASRLCNNEIAFKKIDGFTMPYKFYDNENKDLQLDEFAAWQDDLIQMTKDQTAQIEVKSTAKGTLTFQLPLAVQKSTSKNRPRKDNYTALLLANWGFKLYTDITAEEEMPDYDFKPFVL